MTFRSGLAALTALCILTLCAPAALAEDAPEQAEEIPAVDVYEDVQLEEDFADDPAADPADDMADAPAEDIASVPVEESDQEIDISLVESDDAYLSVEDAADDSAEDIDVDVFEQSDPSDCHIHCPDVCDDVIRNEVAPSTRVYPEPLIWPLKGCEPLANITSHVGWRNAGRIHRRQGGTWASWLHHGVDVGGVDETQSVVAAAGGLAYAGYCDGTGNFVVIDHQNGWYTRYQHLSRFDGDITLDCAAVPVAAGDPIGYVGNTGGNYPVHFHFEIAWSPDGPGGNIKTYQTETNNRKIHAYSFPQQQVVTLRWAQTWEICSAEYQTYLPLEAPEEGNSEIR